MGDKRSPTANHVRRPCCTSQLLATNCYHNGCTSKLRARSSDDICSTSSRGAASTIRRTVHILHGGGAHNCCTSNDLWSTRIWSTDCLWSSSAAYKCIRSDGSQSRWSYHACRVCNNDALEEFGSGDEAYL